MFYRISDLPLWIVPSIHNAKSTFQVPERIFRACEDAERVVFERDLEANSVAYFHGPKVVEALTPHDLARARCVWTGHPFYADPAELDQLEVWSAAESINFAISRYVLNNDYESGVDRQLWHRVPEHKRAWIESSEDLRSAMSIYPEFEQIAELRHACDVALAIREDEEMSLAWTSNKPEVFARMAASIFQRTPIRADTVLTQRNAVMLDYIARDIASGASAVYVIGAAHVFGEPSLRTMLARNGYELTSN